MNYGDSQPFNHNQSYSFVKILTLLTWSAIRNKPWLPADVSIYGRDPQDGTSKHRKIILGRRKFISGRDRTSEDVQDFNDLETADPWFIG